jgi:hypothetical protein
MKVTLRGICIPHASTYTDFCGHASQVIPDWIANAKIGVASSSADDAEAGTGARTIRVYGLDWDWNPVSEDVILNGTTEVAGTLQYRAINYAEVLTAGSGAVNAGDVYVYNVADTVSSGVPQTPNTYLAKKIPTGLGVSSHFNYTQRDGKDLYVTGLSGGFYHTAAAYARIRLGIKEYGGVWKYVTIGEQGTEATMVIHDSFPDPIFVPRKAIVCVKAIASAAGTVSMRLDCEER